jgi:hypothetical protein
LLASRHRLLRQTFELFFEEMLYTEWAGGGRAVDTTSSAAGTVQAAAPCRPSDW